MAYTARLTKQQLRQRRDATCDRSRDNTKETVQYLVTYAYTNNNCLLCASSIIVFVAIPTYSTIAKTHAFVAVSLESSGAWSSEGLEFITELGRRMTNTTLDKLETSY